MRKLRVFVAVLLPEDVRQKVVEWQEAHPDLKVRWKKAERLHTTVVMPWHATHREIDAAKDALEAIARATEPFSVHIRSVRWGPPSAKETPRMIWADGDTPREFRALKRRIMKALRGNLATGFREHDKFSTIAHVTVANFPARPRKALPPLQEQVDWRIDVRAFQLIESVRKRGRTEYRVIASFDFVG